MSLSLVSMATSALALAAPCDDVLEVEACGCLRWKSRLPDVSSLAAGSSDSAWLMVANVES